MIGALADQAVQQGMHKVRKGRTVTVEEEDQHQAKHHFEHAAANLRTARQQPVADFTQIRAGTGEQRRTTGIDVIPENHQALAHQRQTPQPGGWLGQTIDLHGLEQSQARLDMVGQVETQPHQRRRQHQHPHQGQQGRGRRHPDLEWPGQQAHQRPTGEGQYRRPKQRRPERRQHQHTGAQQDKQQNLPQEAVVI